MRRLFTLSLGSLLFLAACQKTDSSSAETETALPEITSRSCAAQDVLDEQMATDPERRKRMADIEAFTQRAIESGETSRLVNGVIEIPVVFHVLYNTTSQNISLTQIQSQIDVFNEDFNLQNADNTLVPTHFSGVKANVGIRFVLDQVIRKATNKKSWGTNDAMKKSQMGGSDPVDPATKLNFWVCNLGQNLLGYAQFPGGNPATDGIVVLYSAVGRTGILVSNYNKGRTATHEIGHWLNLRHIWGDATCGNDYVGDTPLHNTSNGGCPAADHRSTCTGTPLEMWMNYMDYTYDRCMYMFSNGQKDRMLAIFTSGGPRATFAQ